MDMKVLALFLSVILFGIGLEISTPVDVNKILWGNISHFDEDRKDKVAVVNSSTVYESIPEYQTIIREKIKRGTARYTQLILICTEKFKKTAKYVAVTYDYKLIVETGGVKDYPSTDVTQLMIDRISK